MSEYIITDKQLGLIQDFATVCVEGEKLTKIVRCRDCVSYEETGNCTFFECQCGMLAEVEPDGFCAWGERREP